MQSHSANAGSFASRLGEDVGEVPQHAIRDCDQVRGQAVRLRCQHRDLPWDLHVGELQRRQDRQDGISDELVVDRLLHSLVDVGPM